MCPLEELPEPPEFTSCCHTVPMSVVQRVQRKSACACSTTARSSSVRYDCFYVDCFCDLLSLNCVFKVLF